MKTLYSYSILLLATLIVGLSFHSGFIQISYSINKAYIANNLCVNQDMPEMNCNGKCYLNKQLNKSQEKAPLEQTYNNQVSLSWTTPDNHAWVAELPFKEETHTFYFSNELNNGHLKAIDHPPTLG